MSKIIILAVYLITVSTVTADLQRFLGEWTAVASYPDTIKKKDGCFPTTLFTASQEKCTCVGGRTGEIIEIQRAKPEERSNDDKFLLPVVVVDNVNDVVASLNVNCTCAGHEYRQIDVIRSINDNYFALYRYLPMLKNDPYVVLLLARQVLSEEKILETANNIVELQGRKGIVLCSTEILSATTSEQVETPAATHQLFFP